MNVSILSQGTEMNTSLIIIAVAIRMTDIAVLPAITWTHQKDTGLRMKDLANTDNF